MTKHATSAFLQVQIVYFEFVEVNENGNTNNKQVNEFSPPGFEVQ